MKAKQKILLVIGTRPEGIKMAPLVKQLAKLSAIDMRVCVTSQHRAMLDHVLNLFEIAPDYDLGVMRPGQDLTDITVAVVSGMRDVLARYSPDRILVQGDTTSTAVAGLAAYYARIPVGHVEAGLRTGNIYSPWPEEVNRKLIGSIADQHYAPTSWAQQNLLREGVPPEHIHITGNTVVDSLLWATDKLNKDQTLRGAIANRFQYLDENRRLILVTAHRRENFGQGFERICSALKLISERKDVQIVYPVHLNPEVQLPAHEALDGIPNLHLIEPLEYLPFIYLLGRAHVIMTDSGGIQEEAPSLGKPVVLMRDTTERPEGVEAKTTILAGTAENSIVDAVQRLLNDQAYYDGISFRHNPFGDGRACERIADIIQRPE